MPSKRKRVASRQAQLAGRKRRDRSKMRRQDIVPSMTTPVPERPSATSGLGSTSDVDMSSSTTSETVNRPITSPSHRQMRRNRSFSASTEPLPVYPYLKSELRHIGVITAVMAIILGIFTVLLG